MLIHQAFKFRLRIDPQIEQTLFQYAGNCRFLWNKALEINLHYLKEKQPLLWYYELDWFTKLWKSSEEYGFLKRSPAQTLQQTLWQLERAFKDAFDKSQPNKKLPKYKKRGESDTFTYPQGFEIDGNRVRLPKIGWLRFRQSRAIEGLPKNVTVSRQGQHWFVSIQTEREVPTPKHPSRTMVGIDMGVKRLLTVSNGQVEEPIDTTDWQKKVKRLQRRLAKKKRFSQNWKKLKARITRLHTKIANIRRDTLHKLSCTLSKSHAMIVLEHLQIRNMTKSSKGDADSPGKRVKQKSGLNRAILNQGWGMFKDFLEYKQRWAGGDVIFVDPKYSSQTCLACNHISKANRLTQAQFCCEACGFEAHADWVAANTVLERGHRLLACGEHWVADLTEAGTRRLSDKLEPEPV